MVTSPSELRVLEIEDRGRWCRLLDDIIVSLHQSQDRLSFPTEHYGYNIILRHRATRLQNLNLVAKQVRPVILMSAAAPCINL